MKEIVCSFCGHRDCAYEVNTQQIKEKISDLIDNHGVNTFYSGGMGDFDHICESVVRTLQREHKKIKLCLVVPYMMKRLNTDKEYYEMMYDEVIIPDLGDIHYKKAIPERNKWIAEHSDYMLCFIERKYGGAYTTYKYAKKSNVTIIEIHSRFLQ